MKYLISLALAAMSLQCSAQLDTSKALLLLHNWKKCTTRIFPGYVVMHYNQAAQEWDIVQYLTIRKKWIRLRKYQRIRFYESLM